MIVNVSCRKSKPQPKLRFITDLSRVRVIKREVLVIPTPDQIPHEGQICTKLHSGPAQKFIHTKEDALMVLGGTQING